MKHDINCGFLHDSFMKLRKYGSISCLMSVFIMKGVEVCPVTFLHLLRLSCVFCLLLIDVMYFIQWVLDAKTAMHWPTGINSPGSRYIILYILLDFNCKCLAEDFWVYVYNKCWSVLFFSHDVFVWCCCHGDTIDWIGKYSLLLYFFWKCLWRIC